MDRLTTCTSCVSHTFDRLVASSHDSALFAIFNISPEHALKHLFMFSFFFTHRTILDFSFLQRCDCSCCCNA